MCPAAVALLPGTTAFSRALLLPRDHDRAMADLQRAAGPSVLPCSRQQLHSTPSKSFSVVRQPSVVKSQSSTGNVRTPPESPVPRKRPKLIMPCDLPQLDADVPPDRGPSSAKSDSRLSRESSDSGFGGSEASGSDSGAPSKLSECRWIGCNNPYHDGDTLLVDHVIECHVLPAKPVRSGRETRSGREPEYSFKRFACHWQGCKRFGQAPRRGKAMQRFQWLEEHFREFHAGTARAWPCLLNGCPQRFCSKMALTTHLGMKHANKESKIPKPKPECQTSAKRKKKTEPVCFYTVPAVDPTKDFLDELSVEVGIERLRQMESYGFWRFELLNPIRKRGAARRKHFALVTRSVVPNKSSASIKPKTLKMDLNRLQHVLAELKVSAGKYRAK